jgi:hypothetical protein
LRPTGGPESKELRETLADIESLAHLGSYYADKIRGATELSTFRTGGDTSHRDRAVAFLKEAVNHWEAYADLTSSRYKPQLLARTRMLDWQQILQDVKRDVAIAERADPTR